MLSHIILPNAIQVSFLETLGRRDFDLNVVQNQYTTSSDVVLEDPNNLIKNAHSIRAIANDFHPTSTSLSSFPEKKRIFLSYY